MHRSAPRIARLLACAAVPVLLIAGCSSGSDTSANKTPSGSASASASLAQAKFTKLPDPCKAIAQDTVKRLVPKVKDTAGTPAKSALPDARGGCSWNGLDGYQFRWLDVALQRFDSAKGIGSAEDQAKKRFTEQVAAAAQIKGSTSAKADGVGDQATVVSAPVVKDKLQYQDETVVARTGNVIVILSYNGAGFEDAKSPAADQLLKDAVAAAKEAVATVAAANK
ncbi:DUF3558 domain-containing protein [Streptomyces sp. H10-C2]|uniref:DUF3558 domain-containing protein n=1 Tax=unclassified Streptomyces TaxID=2593676 RepID=UPI0024B9C180|nr:MULTISPECIES: DUF3558 domain-containing protein [unclassified Streptomyces]MDJ0341932.1 DUF3558 domain-containing protein [Streptomyces sp. PH10-H1]MDJ0369905.1 DUF3558 domain-containing protein [Streptomyces sp. H10-C2]MDJ0370094.1 DUF3558 domain-containing protein [Streptomyces sp. H10-C2]